VERNYVVATKIDQYGPTIIADAPWIKFLLFSSSVIMMILVIRTLTQKELATTKTDNNLDKIDINRTSPYDDILNTLSVEITKK
jgi:hypothetical protein